jgi:hypothetical protein
MATQTESTARPNKSRANSHSQNGAAQPEIDTTAFVEPLTNDQRHELIAVAAYHLAEGRNFEPGHETEDWLAAESQVRSLGAEVS